MGQKKQDSPKHDVNFKKIYNKRIIAPFTLITYNKSTLSLLLRGVQ